MAQKVIKNAPYIDGDKLVQEQIVFIENKKKVEELNETVVLIENIWEDLKSKSGQWKWNKAKYFYWENEATSLEDETIKVQTEAPQPTREIFDNDLEVLEEDSDWTKYWKTLIDKTEENFEIKSKITEDRIDAQKNTLIDYTPGADGAMYEINDKNNIPKRDDKDLITNLQSILF